MDIGGSANTGVTLAVNRAEHAPENGDRPCIQLLNPVNDLEFAVFARTNLAEARACDGLEMVQQNAFTGQVLALCGAGPSLATEPIHSADEIWGCNSAVTWLHEHDKNPTAAIGIDQTPGMLKDWSDPPDVTYYVASTCDPELIRHLRAHGRRVVFFHNAVGFDDELHHYKEDWPPAFMVGEGSSVLPRMIGLAAWLGFRRIDVYGADCSWGNGEWYDTMKDVWEHDVVHASGSSLAQAYARDTQVMQGMIGGRVWRARPDMLMSAVDLARRVRDSYGRVRLIGDTLAVALIGMDELVLADVIRRLLPGEVPDLNGARKNGQQD